jgi:predicted amidohydrolase
MDDVLTVAAVNFNAAWGAVDRNLGRMLDMAAEAADRGADLVLFPETALSGYDLGEDKSPAMHREAARRAAWAAEALAKLSQARGIYIVVGLPEHDPATDAVYNAAVAVGPDGVVGWHRKLHLPNPEAAWAVTGRTPLVFDTRWGPVGVGICYDTYWFPEVARHAAALGARLYLNPTAINDVADWREIYLNQLKARALENGLFVVSANLFGHDRKSYFPGGAAVIGPGDSMFPKLWAGPDTETEGPLLATIDLSLTADKRRRLPLFQPNSYHGKPDWRPDLYQDMLAEVRARPEWKALLGE